MMEGTDPREIRNWCSVLWCSRQTRGRRRPIQFTPPSRVDRAQARRAELRGSCQHCGDRPHSSLEGRWKAAGMQWLLAPHQPRGRATSTPFTDKITSLAMTSPPKFSKKLEPTLRSSTKLAATRHFRGKIFQRPTGLQPPFLFDLFLVFRIFNPVKEKSLLCSSLHLFIGYLPGISSRQNAVFEASPRVIATTYGRFYQDSVARPCSYFYIFKSSSAALDETINTNDTTDNPEKIICKWQTTSTRWYTSNEPRGRAGETRFRTIWY